MAMDVVDYEIFGDDMQYVEIELDPQEAALERTRLVLVSGMAVLALNVGVPAGVTSISYGRLMGEPGNWLAQPLSWHSLTVKLPW